ncbi:MAG: hypothetical protein ABFS23_09915, partial [Pseudomonadota bacterium]
FGLKNLDDLPTLSELKDFESVNGELELQQVEGNTDMSAPGETAETQQSADAGEGGEPLGGGLPEGAQNELPAKPMARSGEDEEERPRDSE